MDAFEYRKGVKMVAIIDLVLTLFVLITLGLFVGILTLSLFSYAFFQNANRNRIDDLFQIHEYGISRNEVTLLVILVMFTFLLVTFILSTLQLIADMKLLKATDQRSDPEEAAEWARFWRLVTIICLIVSFVTAGLYGKRFIVICLFRIFGLILVHKYIQELDNGVTTPSYEEGAVIYSYARPNYRDFRNGGSVVILQENQNQSAGSANSVPGTTLYPNLKPHPGMGYEFPHEMPPRQQPPHS